jgi:hypothetical protein
MDQAYALHLQELDQNLLHPFTHHIAMHGIGTHIVLRERAVLSVMSQDAEFSMGSRNCRA